MLVLEIIAYVAIAMVLVRPFAEAIGTTIGNFLYWITDWGY